MARRRGWHTAARSCPPRRAARPPAAAARPLPRYQVRDECKQVPYEVIEDASGNVKIKCPNAGKDFAAEEISAQVRRPGAPRRREAAAGGAARLPRQTPRPCPAPCLALGPRPHPVPTTPPPRCCAS
jgi:hypothetical protein